MLASVWQHDRCLYHKIDSKCAVSIVPHLVNGAHTWDVH